MIEKLSPSFHHSEETLQRSLVKSISYRIIISTLDLVLIYLYTRQIEIALGFMILSNTYSTICYFIHERIWDKIKWGKMIFKKNEIEKL